MDGSDQFVHESLQAEGDEFGEELGIGVDERKRSPVAKNRDPDAFWAWIGENGDFMNHISDLILAAVEELRAEGCTSFSIFGQCWGASIMIKAASEPG